LIEIVRHTNFILKVIVLIYGRAFFNRWKEHPYTVLQYTPKSTQK